LKKYDTIKQLNTIIDAKYLKIKLLFFKVKFETALDNSKSKNI